MPKKQLMPLLNELHRTPLVRTSRMSWKWAFSADQVLLLIVIATGVCLFVAWLWWLRSHAQI